jgi:monothiol glutaredoxin
VSCSMPLHHRHQLTVLSEWPTIPQVYIKGEFVGGCDIVLSSKSMSLAGVRRGASADTLVHQSGDLEKLLVKEGLIPELPTLPEDQK